MTLKFAWMNVKPVTLKHEKIANVINGKLNIKRNRNYRFLIIITMSLWSLYKWDWNRLSRAWFIGAFKCYHMWRYCLHVTRVQYLQCISGEKRGCIRGYIRGNILVEGEGKIWMKKREIFFIGKVWCFFNT